MARQAGRLRDQGSCTVRELVSFVFSACHGTYDDRPSANSE